MTIVEIYLDFIPGDDEELVPDSVYELDFFFSTVKGRALNVLTRR